MELMPHIDLEIYTQARTGVDYDFVDERQHA
jgi:hypothetical protein